MVLIVLMGSTISTNKHSSLLPSEIFDFFGLFQTINTLIFQTGAEELITDECACLFYIILVFTNPD